MIDRNLNSNPVLVRMSNDWGWLLVGGIISCILGVVAWRAPVAASAGIATVLGIILLISGIVQLVQTFRLSRYDGVGWKLFQSLISIVGGFLMLRYPVMGMIGVGLTLIFYLFVSSVSQFTMALSLRPVRGSGLLFLSSVVSFFLGVALITQLPISALWIPGVFLAVDLFIGGISLIFFSLRLRDVRHQARVTELPTEKRRAA